MTLSGIDVVKALYSTSRVAVVGGARVMATISADRLSFNIVPFAYDPTSFVSVTIICGDVSSVPSDFLPISFNLLETVRTRAASAIADAAVGLNSACLAVSKLSSLLLVGAMERVPRGYRGPVAWPVLVLPLGFTLLPMLL